MIQAKRKVVFHSKASHAKLNTIPGYPRLSSMVDMARDLFTISLFVSAGILAMYAIYALKAG